MDHRRSVSPSTFILDGGQVFCSGLADIGLGTQGMGESAARIARARDSAQLRAYFEERDAKIREQEAKEASRLARLAKDQELSPRKRLEKVLEAREEEIARMTKERKQFEAEFKEQRAREAAEKNARIHEDKEIIKEQLNVAKIRRELQKEKELKSIRAEREELIRRQKKEEEMLVQMRQEHHSQLRHWHEVCKARALEESAKRLEEKKSSVAEVRHTNAAKKDEIIKVEKEIVGLKSELIKSVQAELKAGRTVFTKREDMLCDQAKEQKLAIKKRELEKKEAAEAYKNQMRAAADEAKTEAQKRQEEFLKAKADQKRVLNEQARLQREKARETIAEERDAVRREKQERFEMNKAAMNRSKSATPY